MYILPTLTYLEVGEPADASEIICFEHFKWEPIAPRGGVMGALLTDSGRVNGTVPGWPIRGPHGLRRGARLAGISQSASLLRVA